MIKRVSLPLVILLLTATAGAPAVAQVPTNDAKRTDTETRTKVCMKRARTFKQASVAPTQGVHSSFTTKNDLGGMNGVSGQSVLGGALSGSSIGGSDFQILMAVANGIEAMRTKNIGQAVNSLAAVAAAIQSNTTTLNTQSATIGTATTQQGAFDQNTMTRLSTAQIWNQAIQAMSNRNAMRNQKLLDQAAAESALSNFMNGKQ
ncbi:hypothetical protein [Agrobacterium tumefaciens]|uniref:hypothetical protein n=1 Tax=Agrobacterium tumefaciens TaxID=358 RepID=UPI001F4339CA